MILCAVWVSRLQALLTYLHLNNIQLLNENVFEPSMYSLSVNHNFIVLGTVTKVSQLCTDVVSVNSHNLFSYKLQFKLEWVKVCITYDQTPEYDCGKSLVKRYKRGNPFSCVEHT